MDKYSRTSITRLQTKSRMVKDQLASAAKRKKKQKSARAEGRKWKEGRCVFVSAEVQRATNTHGLNATREGESIYITEKKKCSSMSLFRTFWKNVWRGSGAKHAEPAERWESVSRLVWGKKRPAVIAPSMASTALMGNLRRTAWNSPSVCLSEDDREGSGHTRPRSGRRVSCDVSKSKQRSRNVSRMASDSSIFSPSAD